VLAAARRQGVAIRDDVGEVADIYDNS